MSAFVFLLTRLRPGASRDDYEAFVRDTDYPTSRGFPAVRSFEVVRLSEMIEPMGSLPYDYVEVVEVDSAEAYRELLENPVLVAMTETWSEFVGDYQIILGDPVR